MQIVLKKRPLRIHGALMMIKEYNHSKETYAYYKMQIQVS